MRNSLLTFVAAIVMVAVVGGVTALAAPAAPALKAPPHWVLIWALNDRPDHVDGFSSATSCQRMADYLLHVNDGRMDMAKVTARCLVVE